MCPSEHCGYDGGKKTKGRKQHFVVEIMGNLLQVIVHETNCDIERQTFNGKTLCVRRVMQVTERKIDKYGQCLLLPMISAEGWWTT